MDQQQVYIFLFDGFSDWEIAYVTPEVHRSEKTKLVTFSLDGQVVTSVGGLKVIPDLALKEVEINKIDLLILPGGEAWNEKVLDEISHLVEATYVREKPIAAICAATTFLGEKGYLDEIRHTSNDLSYMKYVSPNYKGEANYQSEMYAADDNIITANGTAPIEFAREIFKKLALFSDDHLEKWYQLFKNGVFTEDI